jgi:hypothetical protein
MFKAPKTIRPLVAFAALAVLSFSAAAPSSALAEDEIMTAILVAPADDGAPVLMHAAPEQQIKMRAAQKRSTTHRIQVGAAPERAMATLSARSIRAQAAAAVDPSQPKRPRMAWPYTARTVDYY